MPNIHFLCLSESLRQRLITLGISKDQAHNAGYGVDTNFFAPRPSSQAQVIVSAGTASRDYMTLVEASKDLGVELKIAASSRWHEMATELDDYEPPPHVEAKSYGNYMNLRDLYSRAAFVVVPLFPAVHACGYAVIAEAMSMGKAVIVSRTESPSDFVLDSETGFYVTPGDVAELRDKMQTLLEYPDRVRSMGEAARARMQEQFSVDAYAERMEKIVLA
jgi:glycosyltransferase involved in cell wall biosynthesis